MGNGYFIYEEPKQENGDYAQLVGVNDIYDKTVEGRVNGDRIVINAGSKVIEIDGEEVKFNSPAVIERETGLSKAAFKRAVGRLLKNGKIEINQLKIRKVEEK